MAPKRQSNTLPSPSPSDSETDSETHQQESEHASDSDSDLRLKSNGKRPAVDKKVRRSKKSKGAEKVSKDQDSMSDYEPHPHQQESSDSDSDSKANTDKSKSKSTVKKVDKGKGKMSDGDKKVSSFARVYSEEDEIGLLQGMIDFKEEHGTDPSVNMVAFHKYVDNLLSCTVTKRQLSEKMRKLKIKFVKKGQNGEDPLFSNPHDHKLFELSKKIWVGPMKSVMGKTEADTQNWWSSYPFLCASLKSDAIKNFTAGPLSPKMYVKKVISGLNKDKARELEHEWESFSAMEHQVNAKRLELISKQAEAVMKVIQVNANWKI